MQVRDTPVLIEADSHPATLIVGAGGSGINYGPSQSNLTGSAAPGASVTLAAPTWVVSQGGRDGHPADVVLVDTPASPSAGSSAVTPGSGAKSWQVVDQTAASFPMSYHDDNGKLWITADAGDAAQNINLVNRTTTKSASGNTAWFRPQIGFWIQRPGDATPMMRWQAPACDVTSGVAGSDADPRTDMVLAYRRDLVTPANSADVIYIVDEAAGRIGVHQNVPRGTWHIGHRNNIGAGAGALITENLTGTGAWMARWEESGNLRGGVYSNPGQTPNMMIRIGSTVPAFAVDVSGVVNSDFSRWANSTTAWQNDTAPRVYSSSNPGAGAHPFNASGNLIIQPRAENLGAGQDIVLAVGSSTTLTEGITVVGPTNGGPNVGLFGMAATAAAFGNGKGVVGLATATTFPTANPTGGGVISFTSSAFQFICPNGERVAVGQVNSLPGLGFGAARAAPDVRLWRTSAGVLGTDSIVRYDAAASWQTTVGAAGGASALPATPTKYLKVVDNLGTTYVVPAYAAV